MKYDKILPLLVTTLALCSNSTFGCEQGPEETINTDLPLIIKSAKYTISSKEEEFNDKTLRIEMLIDQQADHLPENSRLFLSNEIIEHDMWSAVDHGDIATKEVESVQFREVIENLDDKISGPSLQTASPYAPNRIIKLENNPQIYFQYSIPLNGKRWSEANLFADIKKFIRIVDVNDLLQDNEDGKYSLTIKFAVLNKGTSPELYYLP